LILNLNVKVMALGNSVMILLGIFKVSGVLVQLPVEEEPKLNKENVPHQFQAENHVKVLCY